MYNSMYGGMPGGMMGGGMQGVDPNNPESLTHRFNMSTQATFQMLEGIVGAFGNFAQMLESTYMTTHSSFFAMVAVAEQFSNLRDTLGSVLGIFTLLRWIRTLIAKLTGRPPPADATALTPAAFARFEGRQLPQPSTLPDGSLAAAPKPSRKPLFFFLLAAFGLPYIMSKIIRSLAANAEQHQAQQQQQQQLAAPLDPSKLEFCRVIYDFTPPQPALPDVDMDVRKGDLVAVLSKQDPMGNPSDWWRCRARDGRMGYLPASFLEVARKPGQGLGQGQMRAIKGREDGVSVNGSADSTRANTMTSLGSGDTVAVPVVMNTGDRKSVV